MRRPRGAGGAPPAARRRRQPHAVARAADRRRHRRRDGEAAPGADARRRARRAMSSTSRGIDRRAPRPELRRSCRSPARRTDRRTGIAPSPAAGRLHRRATCYPEPRVRLGLLLGAKPAPRRACMDLSDGLADAARQIADASGVGMIIDAAALPIDPAARALVRARGADPVAEALTGGDDYELLLHGPPARCARRLARGRAARATCRSRASASAPTDARRRAAAAARTTRDRCRRDSATFDDSSHALRSSAAGSTRCSTSTTRRSARRPPSRSASSSASRRSSACTPCSALALRVPAQPQSRRRAARRLLEPAVDHRALLRVRDDGGAAHPRTPAARRVHARSSCALFELVRARRRILASADHDC